MKRGESGLCGILAVDKPTGMTSHDVVDRVRRMTGERRVGHAGTLDPAASGLMFVCVDAATRLSRYLMGHDKAYRARISFGIATDTDDAEGRVLAMAPDGLDAVVEHVAAQDAQAVLAGITGPQMQLPPAYSAIKKDGVTAYKAARAGREIELEARPVTVYEANFVASGCEQANIATVDGGSVQARIPYWDVDFLVSKGTYIRAIARDLGVRLGCGAHLSALRRTLVASTTLASARALEAWGESFANTADVEWTDPVEALGFAHLALDESQVADVVNGKSLPGTGFAPGELVSCTYGTRLMAVYEALDGCLRPATVIPGGVSGVR